MAAGACSRKKPTASPPSQSFVWCCSYRPAAAAALYTELHAAALAVGDGEAAAELLDEGSAAGIWRPEEVGRLATSTLRRLAGARADSATELAWEYFTWLQVSVHTACDHVLPWLGCGG